MEPNAGKVRPDYLVPVEARNYVSDFWRRHDCTSWAYYIPYGQLEGRWRE